MLRLKSHCTHWTQATKHETVLERGSCYSRNILMNWPLFVKLLQRTKFLRCDSKNMYSLTSNLGSRTHGLYMIRFTTKALCAPPPHLSSPAARANFPQYYTYCVSCSLLKRSSIFAVRPPRNQFNQLCTTVVSATLAFETTPSVTSYRTLGSSRMQLFRLNLQCTAILTKLIQNYYLCI